MAPNKNPQYCGVCGKHVIGLTQHEQRSKSHQALYEPIRERLVAQRALGRAANKFAAETSSVFV